MIFSSQLGSKERRSNVELSSKSKGKAVSPPFYMAEKVQSMFLLVRSGLLGRFSTRTAPRLIGSRGAWLRTATLTSLCSATNPSTSELFQRTREKIITLCIFFNAACLRHLSFCGKNCSFLFSFIQIFEALNKMHCTISLGKKETCQTDMANCNIISTAF